MAEDGLVQVTLAGNEAGQSTAVWYVALRRPGPKKNIDLECESPVKEMCGLKYMLLYYLGIG